MILKYLQDSMVSLQLQVSRCREKNEASRFLLDSAVLKIVILLLLIISYNTLQDPKQTRKYSSSNFHTTERKKPSSQFIV
jgi:multisubunit Na+/H+ antiporter MnhB subunit